MWSSWVSRGEKQAWLAASPRMWAAWVKRRRVAKILASAWSQRRAVIDCLQDRKRVYPAAWHYLARSQSLASLIIVCGSHTDTVVTTSRRSRTVVDLTLQHTNHTVLVEGPAIMIRPVGTRRLVVGGS